MLGEPIGGDTIEEDTARDLMNAMIEVLAERPHEAFGLAMQRLGVQSSRTNAARFYLGLALLSDREEDDEWQR